ncbi:hypothetical protein [Planctomyces sp. SH-PL62]|uniref:hypothetical protein n=1 Tax=Planctomyces sp. SH-PL62 TaxID=1636152 RepID=UPI00078C8408|nr:hypothetical protein [Planctomyces sp. SH-PL62]AMV39321.1 hypothetical protein VT85_17930 [Planctomyces sp. SH-PL62]
MSSVLLPQAFWFRVSASCPRVEDLPREGKAGRLLDLPNDCAIPDLAALDGRSSWASVRVGWNSRGIGITVDADGLGANARTPDRAEGFANVVFWIDTRDTRNVSRATRYCHRFQGRMTLGRDKKTLTAEVEQRPIARATADAPLTSPSLLAHRSELIKKGWRFELFLPAAALHGFDPETNRKLGFAYQISDAEREDQFLGIGRDFPLGENPSLWSTLELKG